MYGEGGSSDTLWGEWGKGELFNKGNRNNLIDFLGKREWIMNTELTSNGSKFKTENLNYKDWKLEWITL